ncbi:MAG: benzoylformate decarboxylase [Pseudomonadota bacterium]
MRNQIDASVSASPAARPVTGSVTVRDAVIHLLRGFGMTTVFGNPGSTELPLYRNWPGDFKYILGLQEAAVVAMADGYAQATRNAAFVNLHSAAGVGHALGSIFTAYRNRTPLVITAGQQTRSMLPTDPFLFAQSAAEFPKPYVKWSIEPGRAQDVPAAIARAYYTAMQAPAGPAFVSIPVDDWDETGDIIHPRQLSFRLRPEPRLLSVVANALEASRHPAFVVGAGVDRDGAWDLAVRLSEQVGATVWASPKSSRCSFPENHPQFAGFLPAERNLIAEALSAHDVVLVLGAPAFTYHVETAGPYLAPGTRLYQIVDDPELAAWAPGGTAVIASLDLAIADLLARPMSAARQGKSGRTAAPKIPVSEAIAVKYLMQTLGEVRPHDSIIVEEAPSSRADMQDYVPICRSQSLYATASGGLGFGLPAAVGIALAQSDRRVIALLGDGSSMYAIQALWTAAQHRLAMTFIIVRNGTYGALRGLSRRFELDSPVGVDLPGLDFVALAEGQGCKGVRVRRSSELCQALENALRSEGPSLVEVVVS